MDDLPRTGGKVFISYAHADNASPNHVERWLDRVLEHLHSVQLESNSSVWSDAVIDYGENWHEKIQESLAQAKVAVLLVSSAFLKSRYIREHELPQLLAMRGRDQLLIIPILVRPCAFQEAAYRFPDAKDGPQELVLSTLHTPTSPSKPLSSLPAHEQDALLAKLATHIKQVLEGRSPNSAKSYCAALPSRPQGWGGRKLALLLTGALLLVGVGVPLAFRRSNVMQTSDPPRSPTPSVLFGEFSASDLERLEGATENDVIRLALECESDQIRRFAQVFEQRPAAMLALVQLLEASNSRPRVAIITLPDADAQRLAGATEHDVVRLAAECESEAIRTLAEAFEDQPTVLLEFIKEITKWHESDSS